MEVSILQRLRAGLARPEVPVFLMAFGAYSYFFQAGGWNQNSRFNVVRAVVEHGTVAIDAYHLNTQDKCCRGDRGRCLNAVANPKLNEHYYSDKPPGVALVALLPYVVTRMLSRADPDSDTFVERAAYVCTVVAVSIPCALGVMLLFSLLTWWQVPPLWAAGLALAYGFGTILFPYATLFYGHPLATSLALIAFVLLAQIQSQRCTAGNCRLLLVGFLAGHAVLADFATAVALPPLIIFAAWLPTVRRRVAWLLLGGAGPALILGLYHWLAFGHPFATPYQFFTTVWHRPVSEMISWIPYPEALYNILFPELRGHLWRSPWLVFGIAGAVCMGRLPQLRGPGNFLIATSVLGLWFHSGMPDWAGGSAAGARYSMLILPFLTASIAGLVIGIERWMDRRLRQAVGALFAMLFALLVLRSVFLMLTATAVLPEVHLSIGQPFSQFLVPKFKAGALAINAARLTAPREWPTRKPQPKRAWNLGQLMGLKGLMSLLPLALFIMLCGVYFGWALRAPPAPE